MKSLASFFSLFLILVIACGDKVPKRIITDIPIKTEILGMKLCAISSAHEVERVISKASDTYVWSENQKMDSGFVVRVFATMLPISYGGFSWHCVDVCLNESNKIVSITLSASYESIDIAKEHFDAAEKIFTQKYGKGNLDEKNHSHLWTDEINFVGLQYTESATIGGDNRCFCILQYANNELFKDLQRANTPDV